MSNSDFSGTTLAKNKASQTVFASAIQAAGDAATTAGLVRMAGGKTASTAIHSAVGATVAGSTKVGTPAPATTNAGVTTYSLAKTILAASVRSANRS
jgi:hypothetical protein